MGGIMDNFKFDIISNNNLELAIAIAFTKHNKATHFIKSDNKLVFFWTAHAEAIELPIVFDAKLATILVTEWLHAEAKYGKEPDHDGDNEEGFRVSCDAWGHVAPYGCKAFVRIEPVWAMYGK